MDRDGQDLASARYSPGFFIGSFHAFSCQGAPGSRVVKGLCPGARSELKCLFLHWLGFFFWGGGAYLLIFVFTYYLLFYLLIFKNLFAYSCKLAGWALWTSPVEWAIPVNGLFQTSAPKWDKNQVPTFQGFSKDQMKLSCYHA